MVASLSGSLVGGLAYELTGIVASEASQIEGSTISDNQSGILAGGGVLVRGNVIRGNEGFALGNSAGFCSV